MSTPDRQEILDAWETMDWLKSLIKPESGTIQGDKDRLLHAIQDLAEALPPQPRPTMAEVEWDDDKHYLAEAEHSEYGKVVMVGLDENGLVEFFLSRFHANRCHKVPREDLTPTGKRYTLTEVQE